MQTQTELHDEIAAPHRGFIRYLLWLTVLFLALYALPLCLLQIPSFERWGGSSFGPALDFGFEAVQQNADIVLFGDSSVAVGISPRQMSAALGLTVINLPNTGASLHVTGDMNLRHYLRTNHPPRLIVFYFAPWNLDYSHEPSGPRIYEGEEMLARHGSPTQIISFLRSHPAEALQFPFRFYAANLPAALRAAARHQHPAQEVADAMGYADPLIRRPPLNEPCTIPGDLLRIVPHDTARELIAAYSTPRTKVLFYIAPTPACTNASVLLERDYSDLAASPPVQMPVACFKLDLAYTHLLAGAVPRATALLINAVRSRR